MRRPLLVMTTALALLLTSGGVAAQEEAQAPAAGGFGPAGELTLARTGHTATLLSDGRVLITGGEGIDPDAMSTAEVWDPATSSFGPAETLADPVAEPAMDAVPERTDHSTTLLPDGLGLVIGGTMDAELLAEAQLIEPRSGAAVSAGMLTDPRTGHSATFLRDGRVLVVGGTGPDGPIAAAEVWRSAAKPAKCLGKRPTLFARPGVEFVGSKGNDVIAGSVGADMIAGGGGNDRICGYGGDDIIDGGGGNDIIDGGLGADTLTGAGGKDRLTGAGGDDTLNGGKGKDVCNGGKGTDWLPGCNEAKRTRGTVVVNKNTKLKGPHKGRFIIDKNGVTLDCDGHTVTGPGRSVGFPGIELSKRKGVAVRNCDLRQFNDAFRVLQSHRNTFDGNRMSGLRQGFTLQGSDRNKLTSNHVSDVEGHGIGIFDGSDRNRVRGNVVTDVDIFGFNLNTSDGNVFIGNVSKGNHGPGFVAGAGALSNTFSRNSASDNRGPGFQDETTGFRGDAGTDNHYSDNSCSGNLGGSSSPATLCD